MNIICCSLPAIWGNEMLLGVDGPCPAVISRANTIAPDVCAVVSSTVRTDGAFFVGVICFGSRVPVVLSFFL